MKKLLQSREKIIDLIRLFFKKQGFMEVETPLLVAAPDTSPFNEVFQVSSVLGKPGFLTPSPEFFMKKMLSQGSGNIFQICKAFRDSSETDPLHNPEFTILEWYRINADYLELMNDCENLFKFINQKMNSPLSLGSTWQRITVSQAFQKYAQIDLDKFIDDKVSKKIARQRGYHLDLSTTWEQIYHQLFLNEIEPRLPKNKLLILYDYPAALAACARLKKNNPNYSERFEIYYSGLELGNGYSELTDWQEQLKRLKQEILRRKKLGMRVFNYDKDFILALKKGIPETAGIAVGVDRLIMLFCQASTLEQVLPFPAGKIFSS